MMKIFKNISYSTNSKVFLLQINRNHAGKVIMTVLLILIIIVIIIKIIIIIIIIIKLGGVV